MKDPVEIAERFAELLAEIYGPALRSVILYGSVPRGDAVAGVSDINMLVVVERIRLADLERVTPLARHWIVERRCAPMLIGADEWPRAGDAFAIEVAEMLDHRRVLMGDDPVAGVQVDRTALRSQAEHELRGRLVQLHETLMLAALEPERVGGVLVAALPSFATYFRSALRLAGRPAPARMEEAVRAVATLVGGTPEGCLAMVAGRESREPPWLTVGDPVTTTYYDLVRRVLAYVDDFEEGEER
ncbi:MAG TPA: nucleotidyltransferase domain-containing protein [Gemmatimonadota bacterium]|nr:nucleotidyltransferase domain-containing protein [Gemmatimonadota bacterium]